MKRVNSPRKSQAQSSTDVLQGHFQTSNFNKNRTPLYCFRMNFTNFRVFFLRTLPEDSDLSTLPVPSGLSRFDGKDYQSSKQKIIVCVLNLFIRRLSKF